MRKSKNNAVFFDAINYLGGIKKASDIFGYSKQRLWYQIHKMKSPPNFFLCQKIEKLTNGKFTVKKLRPDVAEYLK